MEIIIEYNENWSYERLYHISDIHIRNTEHHKDEYYTKYKEGEVLKTGVVDNTNARPLYENEKKEWEKNNPGSEIKDILKSDRREESTTTSAPASPVIDGSKYNTN